MDIDRSRFEECDVHTTPVARLCDVAMHRILCRDCNPDEEPCEFYLPVEVEGRPMLLTLTATLSDFARH